MSLGNRELIQAYRDALFRFHPGSTPNEQEIAEACLDISRLGMEAFDRLAPELRQVCQDAAINPVDLLILIEFGGDKHSVFTQASQMAKAAAEFEKAFIAAEIDKLSQKGEKRK